MAKPALGDPRLETWITENHKVKSWLIDSMSPPLMQRFIRLSTAKEIWEAVARTFRRNLPDIDHRTMSQEGTVEGVVQLHLAMARLRVHIFLSGLDSEYTQVRGEILRKDPKLDLESAYAYVRREYQQRQTMGGTNLISENSAMLANRTRQGYPGGPSKSYLERWDFMKKPRKNIAGKVMTVSTTEESMQPTANTTNVVHPGMLSNASHVTSKNSIWIIDIGISTANGSISPITGEGPVILSDTLTLDNVLVVPSLEYNLLSISRITSSLSCTVTFWPYFFVFQDILTRKILGFGPAKIQSFSKARYFVTFIDECTRMTWVSLLRNKNDVRMVSQEFYSMAKTQYQRQICTLQSDHGTKFVDAILVKSAAYLINRTPSRVIDFQTPQQKMESLLSVPHLPNLEPCIFGCYDPLTQKIYVSLDVSFREFEPYYSCRPSGSSLQGEVFSEENLSQKYDENELFEVEDFSSSGAIPSAVVPSGQGHENDKLSATEDVEPINSTSNNLICDSDQNPLNSFVELPISTPLTEESTQNVPSQDALADSKWTMAMNEEMEALQKNNTWELCSLPEGKKTI
ncbi:uncharacterized protein LOC111392690 [Olea europaea var. sylvestris]|uniref:uncharacterized protein LOC111392690 n=1 Tax=Olea europaea var. sylvestris TaxID=158386 RepID=UPI000C1CCEE3|nr:uncharacterized protein LOC111392690 [Olea europaea var. sylvestris]